MIEKESRNKNGGILSFKALELFFNELDLTFSLNLKT
jgi:hypothetical protein